MYWIDYTQQMCFDTLLGSPWPTLHIYTSSLLTHAHSPSTEHGHPLRSGDERSLPQPTTGSSSVVGESPISLSVGPTPVPSPQPSAASSQRSYRSQSGKRRRNHSFGHVSSSSDETIRASTTSLMSHASSQGGHPRLLRTEVGIAELQTRAVWLSVSYFGSCENNLKV